MAQGRGTIQERSPGVWRLRVYAGRDAKGTPIQVTRTFKGGRREAQKELARLVTEVADQSVPVRSTMTMGELLDKWVEFITPLREPGTVRGHRSNVVRLKSRLGDVKAAKLTAQHLDRAYSAWLAEGLSPTTVHHLHATVSAALRQAVRWQVLPRAVTEQASPPPARPKPVRATDPSIVKALISAAETDERPVLAAAIALAAATGCRRGELCGLRWCDWDRAGVLHVRHALKHGLDNRVVELRDTKTHQARKVALDGFASAVLTRQRALAEAWAADVGVSLPETGYILTTDPSGATPTRPDTVTQQFQRLSRRVGVELRFHDLRVRHEAPCIRVG